MTDNTDVGDFHHKFELPHTNCTTLEDHEGVSVGAREWDPSVIDFRINFLEEELREFREAAEKQDHAKMFDALIDLVYVAHGTAHVLGYPWEEGWDAVQAANMAKERALAADDVRSLRQSKWDVVKPEGWEPPNIEAVLYAAGFEV